MQAVLNIFLRVKVIANVFMPISITQARSEFNKLREIIPFLHLISFDLHKRLYNALPPDSLPKSNFVC